MSSPLTEKIRRIIARDGPITIERYMALCLHDPDHGYYRRARPLGRAGDFVTAPEISQIFGELLGLWAAAVWQGMGRPAAVKLIELGPGRGLLLADALRAMTVVPGCRDALHLHLVETSAPLREAQEQALAPFGRVRWHDSLADVPPGPAILLANEFVDALPIRQLVWDRGAWRERLVAMADDGRLVFAAGDPHEEPCGRTWPAGVVRELRPAVETLMAAIGARARSAPLAALVIDYGYEGPGLGDTLQAVARHRYADPLQAPGAADLTAHVDFAALARMAAAEGLAVWGPLSQGDFLLGLGLAARLERLLAGARADQKALLQDGANRLVDPRQMGTLFKVIALTGNGVPPPLPFADDRDAQ